MHIHFFEIMFIGIVFSYFIVSSISYLFLQHETDIIIFNRMKTVINFLFICLSSWLIFSLVDLQSNPKNKIVSKIHEIFVYDNEEYFKANGMVRVVPDRIKIPNGKSQDFVVVEDRFEDIVSFGIYYKPKSYFHLERKD